MENRYEETREIDLFEILYALKKRIFLILTVGLLCGCLGLAYAKVMLTPTYTSTTSMLVLAGDSQLTSLGNLQLETQLTKDYQLMITCTPVLEDVIENLNLDMSVSRLRGSISINYPEDTRFLNLSVTTTDPELAQKLVNELAAVASDFIADKMEVAPPKIIEEGRLPLSKTGPNVKKYTMMGFLLGALLVTGFITVVYGMNDTIKSEEDITKYLGVPTLASVPMRKDSSKKKKKKKRKSAHRGKEDQQ